MSNSRKFSTHPCECHSCVSNCARPGYMLPEDLLWHKDESIIQNYELGWMGGIMHIPADNPVFKDAGIGAGVMQFEWVTIKPTTSGGRCIFLNRDNRCDIHTKHPFGCRAFSCQSPAPKKDPATLYGIGQLFKVWVTEDEAPMYARYRRLVDRISNCGG